MRAVTVASMDTTCRRLALVAVATACAAAGCATDPRFGELPPGAISTSQTTGVVAEICRDHLFDPARAARGLPAGYRFVLAAEATLADPALQALLQSQPQWRHHAVGALCFLSVRHFSVDGQAVEGNGPMPAAFWWAKAVGPRHADMRGEAAWVQLGSWYPTGLQHRSAVLRADPMAEFVEVEVEPAGANQWRLRLVLPTETVAAHVAASGPRVPSRRPQPGHMSVAMSGQAAAYFSVYTYFGHHHQAAQGTWRASGTGVFSEAFGTRVESPALGTVLQDGWSSRAGLYRAAGP